MASPTSRQSRKPKGDYIIYVTEAYRLNANWMPTPRYHSGTLLFEEPGGKIHHTHVNDITLKLRKRHFCVPHDATADAKARLPNTSAMFVRWNCTGSSTDKRGNVTNSYARRTGPCPIFRTV